MFAAPLFAFPFEAAVWLSATGALVAVVSLSLSAWVAPALPGLVLLYRLIQPQTECSVEGLGLLPVAHPER